MGKILFIILVTLLLVLWFKHMGKQRGGRAGKPPAPKQAEDMVRCKVCGVNMPRSEALMSKGQFYCCDEHRRTGQ
ncbi:MAG: hypothetical protein H6935_14790 [Thiobacillus sp.]|nr:hypothetical protein [Thiobacillus sp.]